MKEYPARLTHCNIAFEPAVSTIRCNKCTSGATWERLVSLQLRAVQAAAAAEAGSRSIIGGRATLQAIHP